MSLSGRLLRFIDLIGIHVPVIGHDSGLRWRGHVIGALSSRELPTIEITIGDGVFVGVEAGLQNPEVN
jgi:hypothetical protein